MKAIFTTLLICLVSFPLFANDAFVIDSTVAVGGAKIGSPTMAVNSGVEATIVVEDLFQLVIVVTPIKDNQDFVSAHLSIDGNTVDPSFPVKLGREFKIIIGDSDADLSIVMERYVEETT